MLSMESLAVLPLARAEGIFLESFKILCGTRFIFFLIFFFVRVQYLYIY